MSEDDILALANPALVQMLTEMGFSDLLARRALYRGKYVYFLPVVYI